MAIDVKDPNYKLGEKATYVAVDGVKYAIVRADAWFDQAENAPAPGSKALSLPLGDVTRGRGKFYGVKTVKLAINPDHPAYHAAVHRVTYYPADQVTFTGVSRKKLRSGSSTHSRTDRVGRGKVGVGGMRTKSHGQHLSGAGAPVRKPVGPSPWMDGAGQDPAAWQLQADWGLPRYAQRSLAAIEAGTTPRRSQGTTAEARQ
ncbi:hypothetical protein [Paraburkholderia panacisoli]|uniref:hypothetical protein n=1 Tax=Paraburkholderia panacisoli TaxID=2603818 RepID=UPI001FE6537E|nr:hypothetical protein [Paraburkholderia panacisoli]